MANFGWAYINCSDTGSASGRANGPSGSIQYMTGSDNTDTSTSGSANFTYSSADNLLQLTGTFSITGSISASQLTASGDTIFGDTADDTHQFTGSVYVNGPLSASTNISASAFYGDGSALSNITASILSGAMGQFNTTSGLLITSGNVYLGDGASDITTVASQLTASHGALFSERVVIVDDKSLVFGTGGDSIIRYDEAGSDALVVSGSSTGLWLGGGSVIIDSPLIQITGAIELTGSGQSLLTLHTRDADALKEIVFLKDGATAAAIQINSSEHLFIENENTKDIILRTNNQNALRIIGSQRKVIVGAVSKTSANAELDVEGSAIVSGSLTTTDDINLLDDKKLNLGDSADALIEYDSGTARLAISGSATGIELMGGSIGVDYPGGTVVSGTAGGAGSFLALNSSHQVVVATPAGGGGVTFPYTGDIVGTGSLTIVSGSTQVLDVDSSVEGQGAVRGRMLHQITSGFSLSSGAQAKTGRYISLGASPTTVASTLSYTNVMITPFSGRLISVTYHFPAGVSNQDQSKGQPQWELWVGDVNALKGQTLTNAVSLVAQATASSWPGENIVGGFNVQSGQGTLGGTNSTGSWSFGTGSVVALNFKSGDASNNNYPGQSVMTTVWEFDQLDPYISGSGN